MPSYKITIDNRDAQASIIGAYERALEYIHKRYHQPMYDDWNRRYSKKHPTQQDLDVMAYYDAMGKYDAWAAENGI